MNGGGTQAWQSGQPAAGPGGATGPGWPTTGAPVAGKTTAPLRVVGWVLLVPAILAWLWSYVLPTITTFVKSFQRDTLLAPPTGVGTKNYESIMSNGLPGHLGFALLLALVPLVLAVVLAPLLAWAAHRSGRAGRLVTRGLLALLLVGIAPTVIAAAWMGSNGHGSDRVGAAARATVVGVAGWTSLGLVIAVAATLYLSAMRGRRPVPAVLTVGAVLALGIVAVALQSFAVPVTVASMTNRSVSTPMIDVIRHGFYGMQFGPGAAISTLLLLVLGLLGIAATVILLATRARIEFDGWRDRPGVPDQPGERDRPGVPNQPGALEASRSPARPVALVALVVLGVAVLGTVGYALWPWLGSLTGGDPLPEEASTAGVLANTWGAPLVSTVIGVALAALAGFGIGALRPLGRRSELLLLLFAPWLFVGVGPLAIAGYDRARKLHQVDSFLGLIPPGWLCIPALVIFTLLFSGAYHRTVARGEEPDPLRSLLPALPMIVAAGLLSWLVSAQDLLWPLLIGSSPEHMSAPVAIMVNSNIIGHGGRSVAMGLAFPIPLLVLFALAFVALQIGYFDRLAVRVGREPL